MNQSLKTYPGFTLIEVLIAMTLMALVGLIAWRGLAHISYQRERLSAEADELEAVIRTLSQLERDVILRAPDSILPVSPNTNSPNLSGLPRSIYLMNNPAANTSADDLISFEIIRADPVTPGLWRRVLWQYRDQKLFRSLGAAGRSGALPPPTPSQTAVLKDVALFRIGAFVAAQGWITLASGNKESVDLANTVSPQFSGIEFAFTLLPEGGKTKQDSSSASNALSSSYQRQISFR